jgi:GNAT superfamily N-acetyltransferase
VVRRRSDPQADLRAADDHPAILAVDAERAHQAFGFLTLLRRGADATELDAVDVLPKAHRRGGGCALIDAVGRYQRVLGIAFPRVKTLSDKHPEPGYWNTLALYLAVRFRSPEAFPAPSGLRSSRWRSMEILSDGDEGGWSPDWSARRASAEQQAGSGGRRARSARDSA